MENHSRAVQYLYIQPVFEISLLSGGELIIRHDRIEAEAAFLVRKLAELALSDVRVGLWAIEVLCHLTHDFQASGLC
jgi:hypothetical protein